MAIFWQPLMKVLASADEVPAASDRVTRVVPAMGRPTISSPSSSLGGRCRLRRIAYLSVA